MASLTALPVPRELPDPVEVTLSGLAREAAAGAPVLAPASPAPAPATPPPAPSPVHRYKLRRAATFSGLVAVVGVLLLAAGWRRSLDGDRLAGPVVGVAAVQAAQVREPPPAAPQLPVTPARRQVIHLPAVAAGPAPEDSPARAPETPRPRGRRG